MTERVLKAWLALAALLLILTLSTRLWQRSLGLSDLFLLTQDLPILIGVAAIAAAMRIFTGLADRLAGAFQALAAKPAWRRLKPPARPLVAVLGLATLCGLIGWAGAHFVYDDYALSMDEFMATFGAVIHGHGQLVAPMPALWGAYSPALQPVFAFYSAHSAFWGSAYLPVNAVLRGLAGVVGAEALMNPLLAAISLVTVFGIARRMWPDRPGTALAAAILLASSSQLLVAAMTPYAMTAHLAFNLVWLWLFLRGGRLGHAGAIVVAFLTCGLHQLVFHPLFAAPFVLQLWLERRWRLAGLYTLAYAGICLFWIEYWPLAYQLSGATPAGQPIGASGLGAKVLELLGAFSLNGVGLMAENLIRFVTWQNPLTAPLVLLGAVAAVRAKGTPRALVLGLTFTTLAMFVLMPYQGHGWGYRYLHGLLGSACLLAAWMWTRLTDALPSPQKAAARVAFLALAAVSLLVLFPIRAWQTHRFVHPYAAAEAAIRRAGTDIVLVDDAGVWFGVDLVRNDPYLRGRPVVMDLEFLDEDQVRALCSRHTISIFGHADAVRFEIRTFTLAKADIDDNVRPADLRDLSCGAAHVPIGWIGGGRLS